MILAGRSRKQLSWFFQHQTLLAVEEPHERYIQLAAFKALLIKMIFDKPNSPRVHPLRQLVAVVATQMQAIRSKNIRSISSYSPRALLVAERLAKLSFDETRALAANLKKCLSATEDNHKPDSETIKLALGANLLKDFEDSQLSLLHAGNSIVFKWTLPTTTSSTLNETDSFVLKIEDHLGNAQDVSSYLAANGFEHLIIMPAYAREIFQADEIDKVIHKSESVTLSPFSNTADIQTFRNQALASAHNSVVHAEAAKIYRQMAEVMIAMVFAQAFLPDPKNNNWFFDGSLRLADFKSLVALHNGQLDPYSEDAKRYTCNYSLFLSPPETTTLNQTAISADAFNSYAIGKNIYQFLTNCSLDYLKENEDASSMNFDHEIFSSLIGQRWKVLIQKLLKVQASERLNMIECLQQLEELEWNCIVCQLKNDLKAIRKSHVEILTTISADSLEKSHVEILTTISADSLEKSQSIKCDVLAQLMALSAGCEEVDRVFLMQMRNSINACEAHSNEQLLLSVHKNLQSLLVCKTKKINTTLLQSVASLSLGKYDSTMQNYVQAMQRKIFLTQGLNTQQKIEQKLLELRTGLQAETYYATLKKIINKLHSRFPTVSGTPRDAQQKRQHALSDVLISMPIEKRTQIHKEDYYGQKILQILQCADLPSAGSVEKHSLRESFRASFRRSLRKSEISPPETLPTSGNTRHGSLP